MLLQIMVSKKEKDKKEEEQQEKGERRKKERGEGEKEKKKINISDRQQMKTLGIIKRLRRNNTDLLGSQRRRRQTSVADQ